MMCTDVQIMEMYKMAGADLEIFRGGFWFSGIASCKLKTKKKGHYVVLNVVKVISKAKVSS